MTKRDSFFFALFTCAVIFFLNATLAANMARRSLLNALMAGDTARAEALLKRHVTLNATSFEYALNNAAAAGDEPLVRTLLAYQPRLSLTEALCKAAQGKSPNLVRMLLSHGANPNEHDIWGKSALSSCLEALAIQRLTKPASNTIAEAPGSTIMKLLRQSGAHLTLKEAIYLGEVNDLAFALANGADPNDYSPDASSVLAGAYTCLKRHRSEKRKEAVQHSQEAITLLHAYGAQCRFEETIHLSLSDELKRHLAAGADPNGLKERPPLYEAAAAGHIEIVRILLDYGAKIDAVTPHGKTALMTAAARCHYDIVHLLIARGAHSAKGAARSLF